MTPRGYRIIGLAISGGILLAPSAPPQFIAHLISGVPYVDAARAAATIWEVLCLAGFWFGAWLSGNASRHGVVKAKLSEALITLAELRGHVAQFEAANRQWDEAFQTVLAERDQARQYCADAQLAETQAREECDARLAQIAQLRTAALPREMMCILKNVVTAPVFEKAVLMGLHEDRAKGSNDRERERQRLLRRQMLKLFFQLLDYLRNH